MTVASLLLPAGVFAQTQGPGGVEQVQPDIENTKFQAAGVLNRAEFVRSGAGENYYSTSKLEKGASVVVVGAKGSWLKILPPEGSFSYVQKVSVQKFGDGKQGKVMGTQQPWVRAGSNLLPLMWAMQTRLQPRDTVEIIGEDDLYFRIKPPAGAYLYISKDAVDAKQMVEVTANGQVKPAVEAPAATPPATPAPSEAPAVVENPPAAVTPVPPPVSPAAIAPLPPAVAEATAAPQTKPALAEAPPAAPAVEPTTPAVEEAPARTLTAAEAVTKLQELEARFAEASQMSLESQPLAELTRGYQQIADAQGINDVTKRVADVRLTTLKVRTDARDMQRSAETARRAGAEKLTAQRAENQELRQQIAQAQITLYTAVGTLRESSLQVSKTPLYRITDPATGRTLAYVWGTDPKVGTLVDKFVGIRGAVANDARLSVRVINPSSIESIAPAGFNEVYAADIAPASMQPRGATATTQSPEN
jgi:hypothetical protein